MKKLIFIVISATVISFLFQSCNRKVGPSGFPKLTTVDFDSTAFDYVFTEALKQKFLGNAGDALKYLEQCVKINPKSDAAFYEMAQIALMLSDQKNGKKFALKAVSLNEKNLWYLMMVANIFYQGKNMDSAIIYYEKAIKYFPDKENLKINLANIYSERGQYSKAEDIYNYFEKKYGVNESNSLSIIKNLMNSGDFKKAEEKIQGLLLKYPDEVLYNGILAEIYRSSGEKEKAAVVYKKLLEKDPGNPETLLSVSDFLLNEKQYENLFPILNKIILNETISRGEKISLFSRIVIDSNLIISHSRELELTLILLESNYKDDDIIVLLRPELYQNQDNISKAILRLEEIITEMPEDYYAWERLLYMYSETGNFQKLLIRGKECATKFNTSFIAKVLYANAAMESKLYQVAEEELRKAKILAGNDTVKQVQVLTMDADLLYRTKEYSKSFETFEQALKISKGDIIVLNNYAYYLAEQGKDLKEAERMIKMVVSKEKNNTTYLDTYAWVLYKRGRFKEAQKIMEMVINMGNKQDAEWFEHLGYIMKAMKNCNKAVEYWKLAFKLDNHKTELQKEIENCEKR
jgi:tetratricopeptide (TPR) repeat protein